MNIHLYLKHCTFGSFLHAAHLLDLYVCHWPPGLRCTGSRAKKTPKKTTKKQQQSSEEVQISIKQKQNLVTCRWHPSHWITIWGHMIVFHEMLTSERTNDQTNKVKSTTYENFWISDQTTLTISDKHKQVWRVCTEGSWKWNTWNLLEWFGSRGRET